MVRQALTFDSPLYFISECERCTLLEFGVHTTFTKDVREADRKQGGKLRAEVVFRNLGLFTEVGRHHS